MVRLTLLLAVGCGTLLYLGWKTTARAAYESASYTTVKTDGDFTIRRYPDLTVASTGMQSVRGDDGSFMRLFQYISGSNQADQKIAMTTPVFMEPSAEGKPGRMAFVLPAEVAQAGAPQPTGEAVEVGKRPGGRFAVVRFSGRMDQALAAEKERELRQWIQRQGLEAVGKAETAGYDPPWTPGPLRRNEVLIRLKGD